MHSVWKFTKKSLIWQHYERSELKKFIPFLRRKSSYILARKFKMVHFSWFLNTVIKVLEALRIKSCCWWKTCALLLSISFACFFSCKKSLYALFLGLWIREENSSLCFGLILFCPVILLLLFDGGKSFAFLLLAMSMLASMLIMRAVFTVWPTPRMKGPVANIVLVCHFRRGPRPIPTCSP